MLKIIFYRYSIFFYGEMEQNLCEFMTSSVISSYGANTSKLFFQEIEYM